MTLTVRPATLAQAQEFLTQAGFRPERQGGDIGLFLRTALGDDIQVVERDGLALLLVLRHDRDRQETLVRAAAKRGGGDATEMAREAIAQGRLQVQPTIIADVQVAQVLSKLATQTGGVAGAQQIRWRSDWQPMEVSDV